MLTRCIDAAVTPPMPRATQQIATPCAIWASHGLNVTMTSLSDTGRSRAHCLSLRHSRVKASASLAIRPACSRIFFKFLLAGIIFRLISGLAGFLRKSTFAADFRLITNISAKIRWKQGQ